MKIMRLESEFGAEIHELLCEVYVEGGFVKKDRATAIFQPDILLAMGELWGAVDKSGTLAGVVVLVPPGYENKKYAGPGEAEIRCLAVKASSRGKGVGRKLVDLCIAKALAYKSRQIMLWTQPAMKSAQHLYTSLGFVRNKVRDTQEDGRIYWIYEKPFLG